MNTRHIVEHLKIAKDLARADGHTFVVYLIEMAITAMKAMATDENSDRSAA
jgi:hypothetical protein